jgi:hypothetical protein
LLLHVHLRSHGPNYLLSRCAFGVAG